MIANDKKRVAVTMDKDLVEELDREAEKRGLTKSEIVSYLVTGALAYVSGEILGDALARLLKGVLNGKEE